MPAILAIIRGLYRNHVKSIYRKNHISPYFIEFLECTLNFEYIGKKIEPHSLSISEITHSRKEFYLNAKQVLFQNTLRQSTC